VPKNAPPRIFGRVMWAGRSLVRLVAVGCVLL
jgi:hypothetical protein